MNMQQPPLHPRKPWLLACMAPLAIAAPLHVRAQNQVIWETVTEQQAEQLQILVPSVDGGADSDQTTPSQTQVTPQPIVWEVVPDTADPSNISGPGPTAVVWEPLPNNPSVADDGSCDCDASNAY